jgi:hypothetical protein
LVQKLKAPIQFRGFESDPKMTLQEALDFLADRYDVGFDIDETAFKAEKLDSVLSTPIAVQCLPKMANVRLERVLQKILARVPAQSGVTYLIRVDLIEITTLARARAEVYGDNYNGPYLPLVQASFDRCLLSEALRELADESGVGIVLDARTSEKAKTAVTARFANTPVDRAVRLLADMADLKSVLQGNSLYVTTKENADRIRAEEKEERPCQRMPPAEDAPTDAR